jgi:hypothetical protein
MAFECGEPFRTVLACEGWMAPVVSRCDGAKIWRELFAGAKSAAAIPDAITAGEFTGRLAALVRSGVLTCQG